MNITAGCLLILRVRCTADSVHSGACCVKIHALRLLSANIITYN